MFEITLSVRIMNVFGQEQTQPLSSLAGVQSHRVIFLPQHGLNYGRQFSTNQVYICLKNPGAGSIHYTRYIMLPTYYTLHNLVQKISNIGAAAAFVAVSAELVPAFHLDISFAGVGQGLQSLRLFVLSHHLLCTTT